MAPHHRFPRLFLLLSLLLALVAPASAQARVIANPSFGRALFGWRAEGSSLRAVRGSKRSRYALRVTPRTGVKTFAVSRSGPLVRSGLGRFYRFGAWLRGRRTRVCLTLRERVGSDVLGSGERCLRVGRQWRRGTVVYRAGSRGRIELVAYAARKKRGQRFFVERVSFSRSSVPPTRARHDAPVNTQSPTITANADAGSSLLGLAGSWTGTVPLTYSYQWRRCNASGQACTDIAGAITTTLALTPADVGSTLRLRVTARNLYGSATATSAATAVVEDPAPPPPPPPVPPPGGPSVGVVFHCTWGDYTDAQRAQVLDRLQAAGVRWVRMDIGWSSLEEVARGQLSQWYVDLVDRCVNLARARGLNVLGMLFRTPAWANGGGGVMVPPLDMADYAWIAHWLADHFRERVQAWEIWNEPDPRQASWSWSGTVGQYVELLQAAYPAIKSADPDALVVFGGPSWNDTTFVSAAYAAGARGSFDVMAVHPYQAIANLPPEQVGDSNTWWFSRADSIYDVMVRNGDGDKKLWFTEFGWSSHANAPGTPNWQLGVTEAQQGDYLVRAVEYAKTHFPYVTNMFWYNERNEAGQDIQNANYGLLTYNLAPKPAYSALQAYLTG